MKKISPTPRSITHKNPIKISPSSKKSHKPSKIKYSPERYQRDSMLKVFTRITVVIRSKICNKKTSVYKGYKHVN